MEVGVRELKQKLSSYLDAAERGDEVIVTERGRPKVRIVPVSDRGSLQRGVDEGWIRPARRDATVGNAVRHPSTRRTADVLDEDRG
jgi:prevent-host-death family protein